MGETRQKKPSQRSLKAELKKAVAVSPGGAIDDISLQASLKQNDSTAVTVSGPPVFPANEEPLPDCFELRHVDNKGLGLVAARRIPQGTLVLNEPSLIRLTVSEETCQDGVDGILETKFDNLPRSARKSFLRLHDAKKTGFGTLRSLYFSNCYNLADSRSEQGGSCVGLIASRMNHSCVPNVQFSFREARSTQKPLRQKRTSPDDSGYDTEKEIKNSNQPHPGWIQFRVLKTIMPGEELVSNYESVYLVRSERQHSQLAYYGFKCDCKACGMCSPYSHWGGSDRRRQRMITIKHFVEQAELRWRLKFREGQRAKTEEARTDLDGGSAQRVQSTTTYLVPTHGLQGDAASVLEGLQKLKKLLYDEALKGLELANVCRHLAKWSARANNAEMVRHWLEEERQICVIAFGTESPRVKDIKHHLRDGTVDQARWCGSNNCDRSMMDHLAFGWELECASKYGKNLD